jgi:hypothetical protein
MIDINLWIVALTKPVATFKQQEKNANWNRGFWNILIAAVIAGIISGLWSLFGFLTVLAYMGEYASLFILTETLFIIGAFIGTPIAMIIVWVVASFVLDWIMTALGKKGDVKKLAYLTSLFWAPTSIISSVLNLIPIAGSVLALLVALYSIYLLVLALNNVYKLGLKFGGK